MGKKFDLLDIVLKFEETGFETEEEMAEAFQYLIDTGTAWTLQGVYGRTAMSLIEAGLCHR